MAKFIELEAPAFGVGFPQSYAEKNGLFDPPKAYINVDQICSIERYIGKLMYDGWDCCAVFMKNGHRHIDKRSPEQLIEAIS